MARTKASVGSKVSSFKSSKARCSAAPAVSNSFSSGGSERQSRGTSGGGNPVCHRETPKWQKPITNFFICKDGNNDIVEDTESGTSNMTNNKTEMESKNGNITPELDVGNGNVELDIGNLESENNVQESEIPKNRVLDESIELYPLNGENSHKIEEYYDKGNKGKGVGKKTKGKENRRESKRNREDSEEGVSKKVKVDEQ